MPESYSKIEQYWNENPCSGGIDKLTFGFLKDNKVLEIGCGTGNDAVKFIEAGAKYHGIDLTNQAVWLTKRKIGNKGVVYKMNAEFMDFPDNYFDIVYSWGVIHHTLNPQNVIREIHRVLKRDGMLFIMVYNRFSFRYLVEILILRKILWWLHHPAYNVIRLKIPHPTKEEWLSINTDNLGCPLSRVYSAKECRKLFYQFSNLRTWTVSKGWFRIVLGRK